MKDTVRESLGAYVLLLFAVAVSTLWIVLAALYLRELHATVGIRSLNPDEAAELLAGVGGPLAALWLFVAVMEQRQRLSVLTKAIGELFRQYRHSLVIADSQTRSLIVMQNQAKREQQADVRRLVLQDLAASAAVLAERLGVLRREDVDMAWARFGSGDIAAFVQPFLAFAASHVELGDRLADAVARDQVVAAALAAYMRRYDMLLDREEADVQSIIDEGPLGRAFRLFKPALVPVDAVAPSPPIGAAPAQAGSPAMDRSPATVTSA